MERNIERLQSLWIKTSNFHFSFSCRSISHDIYSLLIWTFYSFVPVLLQGKDWHFSLRVCCSRSCWFRREYIEYCEKLRSIFCHSYNNNNSFTNSGIDRSLRETFTTSIHNFDERVILIVLEKRIKGKPPDWLVRLLITGKKIVWTEKLNFMYMDESDKRILQFPIFLSFRLITVDNFQRQFVKIYFLSLSA